MRSVILINFWDKGGMRHYADAVAGALGERVRVHYIANYVPEDRPSVIAHRVPLHRTMLHPGNLLTVFRLVRLLLRLPGPVYMTSDHPVLVLLYPLLAFRRTVLVIHDAQSHQGERPAKVWFHRLHLNLFAAVLRRFVVHSQRIAGQLPWMIRRRNPAVIPHLTYRPKETLGNAPPVGEGPFRLLFFGRILAYKGLDTLHRAMAILPESEFHLTVAGEGVISSVYAGSNQTVIDRFIADEEMYRLFAECHAVVLPYKAASQSGVAYMALAHGKPVISTRVGAIPEVIHHQHNGYLVPPDDPQALALAIAGAADPRTYASLCDHVMQETRDNRALVIRRIIEVCFD